MISGRGLGHSGGTTDKVEAIPGYNTAPDFETFKKIVKTTGCAIIGQTADLAPADRRLYAIRDVTATVASIPLITASILSKKIAAGLGALVMDVKTGNGAFMESIEKSEALANSIIINTAAKAGVTTHALITDMNEVLGTTAGNAVEIAESIRYLRNEQREHRLDEVVIALSAEMLVAGGIESDREVAKARCDDAVTSGRAAEIFGRMTAALGGPSDFVDNHAKYLPRAPVVRPVRADGILAEVDTRAVGNAIIELGGGRRKVGDKLDLSVGFTDVASIGTRIDAERPLAVIHAATEADADAAESNLLAACRLSAETPEPRPVICGILEGRA
jgi:thymidine phosphorylase